MLNAVKIAEFSAHARAELASLANDNQPPAKAERLHRLMEIVLDPSPSPPDIIRPDRPLTDAELRAIRSLIAYDANEFGVFEHLITLAVEITFDIADLTDLRAAQFDAVMRYLVGLLEGGQP